MGRPTYLTTQENYIFALSLKDESIVFPPLDDCDFSELIMPDLGGPKPVIHGFYSNELELNNNIRKIFEFESYANSNKNSLFGIVLLNKKNQYAIEKYLDEEDVAYENLIDKSEGEYSPGIKIVDIEKAQYIKFRSILIPCCSLREIDDETNLEQLRQMMCTVILNTEIGVEITYTYDLLPFFDHIDRSLFYYQFYISAENEKLDEVELHKQNEAYAFYRGVPEDFFRLGKDYHLGRGTIINYTEANKLYQKALDGGYVAAACNLGSLYLHGQGVNQDSKRAINLYEYAAKADDNVALSALGDIYSNGKYVPSDIPKAEKYFLKAIDKGNYNAAVFLGELYEEGKLKDVNYKNALIWYEKAASNGVYYGYYKIAKLYKDGKGKTKNYLHAIENFKKAIELSDIENPSVIECYIQIGMLYASDLLKDYKQAEVWLIKAAETGDKNAQFILGITYLENEHLKDIEKAKYWLIKSAEQGDENAIKKCNEKGFIFEIENSEDIDIYVKKLKEILNKYPDILHDNKRLKSILSDYYPQDRMIRNLLYMCVEERIIDEFSNVKSISKLELHRLAKRLIESRGCAADNANQAVKIWRCALDIIVVND